VVVRAVRRELERRWVVVAARGADRRLPSYPPLRPPGDLER